MLAKNKIISIIIMSICAVLAVTLGCVFGVNNSSPKTDLNTSVKADTYTSGNYTYTYTAGSGTCSIESRYKYSSKLSGDITLPSSVTIDNSVYIVTGITSATSETSGAFYRCYELTSITIPDSITTIGDYAFYNCNNLTSITIGKNVTTIGEYVFYSCTALINITIPDNVTTIGDYSFDSCTALTSVTIGKNVTSIGYHAFNSCSEITKVTATSLESWLKISFEGYANPLNDGCDLYIGSTLLTNVEIPNTITKINNNAFEGCTSITNVTIPNSVKSIGYDAFYECYCLVSVVIPDSVTSIGSAAFGYCRGLTSITIGNGITSIASRTFDYCDRLTSVIIPESVTSIGSKAFYSCNKLTSVTIPKNVKSISSNAFQYCDRLTNVYFTQTNNFTMSSNAFTGGNNSVKYYFASKSVLDNTNTNYGTTSYFTNTNFYLCIVFAFESNGGTEYVSNAVASGSSYGTLPIPTKTGYTFDGWYKSSDFSGGAVTSSDIVTEDHTLYAKWTGYTYYIDYEGNGAMGGVMSNSTHTYDTAKNLTTNTYIRTGYSFLGWSTSSTATTATYTNGQSVTNLTSTNGGMIVLYAVWQANPYTITIQAQSGGSVTSTGGKYASGDIISVGAMPEVGNAFLYWLRASDGAEITENPLNETVTKNETYTAVFGASVEGIFVTSTIGGIAYVIADNYRNLSDTDTITFVTKQILHGYTFSHWIDMDGNNLGIEMSIRLTKSQVMDNLITAVYVQNTNTNTNDDLNN